MVAVARRLALKVSSVLDLRKKGRQTEPRAKMAAHLVMQCGDVQAHVRVHETTQACVCMHVHIHVYGYTYVLL